VFWTKFDREIYEKAGAWLQKKIAKLGLQPRNVFSQRNMVQNKKSQHVLTQTPGSFLFSGRNSTTG
jgi:hypothetical protein